MKILFSLLITLVCPNFAFGCSCQTLSEEDKAVRLNNASTVFYGEVLSAERKIITIKNERGEEKFESITIDYKFKVEKFWKGITSEEIIIQTRDDSCKVKFEIGQKTFVTAFKFSNEDSIPPYVGYCDLAVKNLVLNDYLDKVFGNGKTFEENNFFVWLWQKIVSFFS